MRRLGRQVVRSMIYLMKQKLGSFVPDGTRHIGDFRDWKNHDSHKKEFDRLLRDLKAV